MLTGEPAPTQADLRFSLFGIPVRIHPFFWLAGLLLGPRSGGAQDVVSWMVAFLLGILCHELGHALVARSQGYAPRITLYGLGGMASYDRTMGFSTARNEGWRQIAISVAGPLAGFLLAAAAIALILVSGHRVDPDIGAPYGLMFHPVLFLDDPTSVFKLLRFADQLLFVTIVYGILNLLPVYPLDGGQIAREVFVILLGPDGIRQSLILSLIVAVFLAALGALKWHDYFIAILFGFLAYASFAALEAYSGRRPW